MATVALDIPTAEWALPLLEPARYKGASGGRSSGKSHFFAELAVEEMLCDPSLRFVCIREVQRSLKFSAKSLVESKIRSVVPGHEDHFEILTTEIRRRGGTGVMIFEGMQDHTADSLKSLEGFGRAWVEEAQSISQRSLDLLLPTIRAPGSEVWFSWNPDQPEDPVDRFFEGDPEGAVRMHSTYLDNPFCPDVMLTEAERMERVDLDAYAHIWLGEYNVKNEARVLAGKYRVDEFDVPLDRHGSSTWDGPYHGCDHGFAQDPRTLVRCWVDGRRLYVEHESYHVGLSIDRAATQWEADVPGFSGYVVRAESAEPGTNDYLQRHGVPRIEGVKKWQGSVEDGIAHLRQYDEIVIHKRCVNTIQEARLYSYKVDKRTGDILPKIEDRHNHCIDAIRYALAPLIVQQGKRFHFG
jgi:phage terminase large subunit